MKRQDVELLKQVYDEVTGGQEFLENIDQMKKFKSIIDSEFELLHLQNISINEERVVICPECKSKETTLVFGIYNLDCNCGHSWQIEC